VDWNRNVESWICTVEQPRVASLLMVNVEASAQQRRDHLFGLEDRELRRHAGQRLRNGNGHAFCSHFGKVSGDWLPRQDDAFQITPDRVSRHFARLFEGCTERADLRNRGNENTEAAFQERFENRSVAVFRHTSIVAEKVWQAVRLRDHDGTAGR